MNLERLDQANQILKTYAPYCLLTGSRGCVYLSWETTVEKQTKRWVPRRRGSDWPSIRPPFGGTCTLATMELYRWICGKPIRPLGMWKVFCGKTIGMNPRAAELAESFGWPEQVPCVFCGRLLGNGVSYDHYERYGHDVGPGCWYGEGCEVPQ